MLPPLACLNQSFPVLIPLHAFLNTFNNLNAMTGKNFKAAIIITFNYIKENKLTINKKGKKSQNREIKSIKKNQMHILEKKNTIGKISIK